MTFSISIGSYSLPNFVELGLRACRSVFGASIPLLVYDGRSPQSEKIKELADRFDASYLVDRVNRSHFAGCIENAVCSLAFARANNCEISCKINQRTILLSEDLPSLFEEVFRDEKIDLALPRAPRAETIVDSKSKFHSRFPLSPDLILMRAAKIDPQWLADKYAEQVRTDTSRHGALTEHFWDNMTKGEFKGRWKDLPFMTEPSDPPMYLRKVQFTEMDYNREALKLGMSCGSFTTQEWGAILGAAYRPLPTV